MAKRRKITRRGKRVSPALSPANLRALIRLKKSTDAAYRNFWLVALGVKPPKPPMTGALLERLGRSIEIIAKGLPPPRPPL